eukprot:CAMPEP_0185694796 /NCGR_PEP_ID=MMETSP1164-20130828/4127_1 /TAXON_ID=1104430 /ORGANISM="Chrysoreinhardia sp, Strain CCMP2950" /LENGTH=116 /DNA_ID=CAMNT_0028361647 /DNA_START=39 /DNA_END=389 /DNA_ORIENTATION=+
MNVIPLVLPKVEHLVSTETRTWPLKVLIVHFAFVVLAVLLMASVLATRNPSRSTRVFFGAIGVLNGVLVALVLGITAVRAIYNPRTLQSSEKGDEPKTMSPPGDIEAVDAAVEVQG